MLKASFKKYQLHFKNPVLTSRGSMAVKNGYYLFIFDGKTTGVGECSFIEGLSIDNLEQYETALEDLCRFIETTNEEFLHHFHSFPSIAFAYETALLDLKNGGKKILYESNFTAGKSNMPINGLIWMGSKEFMQQQIQAKLNDGFRCIKIKVGAINFEEEINLLEFIRKKFPADVIEIRLDANGAFEYEHALQKLEKLFAFQIHSIEQPIKAGQIQHMMQLCKESPIPIALDEELIGVNAAVRDDLLDIIRPAYIILKPSLLGGIAACEDWIAKAEKYKINWWATSALESNIGLNAIAQWVFTKHNSLVQGLGTGSLYTDNISSPLYIANGTIGFNPKLSWDKITD